MKRICTFLSKKSLILWLMVISITILLTILTIGKSYETIYIDKDYKYALKTADRYLYAWMMRDGSIAYDLISDKIKRNYTDLADFQKHFAGLSNPHHEAFEIMGCKRLSEDRIRFRVWYYEDYTGIYEPPYKRPVKSDYIELVRVNEDTWLVDEM